jgi:HSP20 family protein
MSLIKWRRNDVYEPAVDFDRLQDEINKLFDFDRGPSMTGLYDRVLSPAIDVVESPENFTVTCDLPGVDMKDLDVSIANNVLTIKGEKKEEKSAKETKVYRRESWTGSFQRTLSLPNTVNPDKIEAVMSEGVLKITLPKREEVKPKQIAVKIS